MDKIFFHNTTSQWLYAGVAIISLLLLIKIFTILLDKKISIWVKRSSTKLDDYLVEGIKKHGIPILYFIAIYACLCQLVFPKFIETAIKTVFICCITFFVLRFIINVITKIIYAYVDTQNDNESKRKQAKGLIVIVNILITLLGVIFLADNFGYKITTLIAGMGIGGIAIALAAQNILGDLFCYFTIIFDKPFEIGDFVVVDDFSGTIEHIGIKTTRIRSLEGEQLVFSNADITGSRLHNYKRMERRRIVFSIGVVYDTPYQKLKAIPEIIKEIIEKIDNVSFDRGHLKSMGDFSINYEFVYFVASSDYNDFMNVQQDIYLAIYKSFEEKQIEFAFPTQTLYVAPANR
jgi:small-conductance mechanosensitive channel